MHGLMEVTSYAWVDGGRFITDHRTEYSSHIMIDQWWLN